MNGNASLDDLALQWSTLQTRAIPDLVLKIWSLLEAEAFPTASISRLDSLQCAEKFLWPTYSDDASDQHALLLASLLTYKSDARLLQWSSFVEPADRFSALFHRILSLTIDTSTTITSRLLSLRFIATCFQSLEQNIIRRECAPLVSIAIWENLHADTKRQSELDQVAARRKAWRSKVKRYEAANQETKSKMRLERAWLYNSVLDFLRRANADSVGKTDTIYCCRFIEFLIDLISQLPTRRYTVVLLKDLHVVPLLRLSALHRRDDAHVLRGLTSLLEQFCSFEIDDAGQIYASRHTIQRQVLQSLQKIAMQHFEHRLRVLALSNLATIGNAEELIQLLEPLTDGELQQLCSLMQMRTTYPPSAGILADRKFLLHCLASTFASTPDIKDLMQQISIVPTERSLYDETLLHNETYDGTGPLAVPKLNLQYLTLHDFLWRSFQLQQAEAFYEIRKDMEAIVRRLKPQLARGPGGATTFTGFSKMAIPIEKPAIIDVLPPLVGEIEPAHVRAEVVLDISRLGDRVQSEWDNLRPKDTVFLLAVQPCGDSVDSGGGPKGSHRYEDHGIRHLRTAEVVQVQDERGKLLREHGQMNGNVTHGRTRRLLLDLDSKAFQIDRAALKDGKLDIYKSLNVVVRRSSRENNFKPMLESIQQLLLSDTSLPVWLQEVYLGYGQPSSATYPHTDSKVIDIDFLDTFLDEQHLQDSFPSGTLNHDGIHFPTPPYVLHYNTVEADDAPSNPKKRSRVQMEAEGAPTTIRISSYQPSNTGPYPTDAPKKNRIRFTPTQVQALVRGSQPGLSLIVGPPGTGKTDVATQLINILYHNFPEERILLIAHSNQALNQLFQKIIALDIDQRHLLRLGYGEGELGTEESFGKYGRVESFMENRHALLAEVNRLAASIDVQGAHGNSCETSDYFYQVFVQPAWIRFWSTAENASDASSITASFPFHKFFANAPIPDLFPPTATAEQCREIARGCQSHITRLFNELETIRPFEILRNPRDQANHLLIKEARIVAMTSTHAAIRRTEIAELGFHYDTLVMEEAAQITEIESFVPCAMQNADPKTGDLPLKRIVLVGDHLQNSPVVQNHALRGYANLEQSLFLRLIRLGVPHTLLDAQGRCRPSITELFKWRYPALHNLKHITSEPEFKSANAGFRHEYQFIHVPEYQNQGEREPTPHFIQNLGEAEYAVALFQYMRLLGYPAKSITILAAYSGQRALIRDVLDHRCKGNMLFGLPKAVSTIDRYQGEQNDYIVLSLTRTKTVGFMRDVRRLTVALSRARLGLYILGRREVFGELPGFDIAVQKSIGEGHLEVVTGEMFPTRREVDADVGCTQIHSIEHMGQYVYEMTQTKIKALGGNISLKQGSNEDELADNDELQDAAEADVEIDPLHENV